MMLRLDEYVFHRLQSHKIGHICCVPGDFNLNLLDHIDSVPDLIWVDTGNELNAAYSAHVYARCRSLPAVVVVTYGVGESSAINAIGGADAEHLPVIYIIETTSWAAQTVSLLNHHTLSDGLYNGIFGKISDPLTIGKTHLQDDALFTQEIDRVIATCVRIDMPVCLYVPIDTPDFLVDASALSEPWDIKIVNDQQKDTEALFKESI